MSNPLLKLTLTTGLYILFLYISPHDYKKYHWFRGRMYFKFPPSLLIVSQHVRNAVQWWWSVSKERFLGTRDAVAASGATVAEADDRNLRNPYGEGQLIKETERSGDDVTWSWCSQRRVSMYQSLMCNIRFAWITYFSLNSFTEELFIFTICWIGPLINGQDRIQKPKPLVKQFVICFGLLIDNAF